jgi:hypothetical protein
MKRRTKYTAVLLGALAIWVIGLGCWPFLTWSRLNCCCEEIDINSGRIRERRYLLGLCVYRSVRDTSLSRVVSAGGQPEAADWRSVNTFSPFVHYSPHYRYHGAVNDVERLTTCWDLCDFSPVAKQEVATCVLSLWHSDEGYRAVSDYLNKLESVVEKRQGSVIGIEDLPSSNGAATKPQ